MKNSTGTAQIWFYLAIVFACILIITAVYLGLNLSLTQAPWIFVLGSFSPTLAAVVVTAFVSGKKGVKELFALWRVQATNSKWLLLVLSPFFVAAVGVLIYNLALGGAWKDAKMLTISGWIGLLLPALIVGALGEETGWRGFMLHRLLDKMSVIPASLFLGVFWTLFHLPLWFIQDSGYTMPIWMFALILFSVTFIITIAFNESKSILAGYITHAAFNFTGGVVMTTGLLPYDNYFFVMCLCYPVWAVLMLFVFRTKLK